MGFGKIMKTKERLRRGFMVFGGLVLVSVLLIKLVTCLNYNTKNDWQSNKLSYTLEDLTPPVIGAHANESSNRHERTTDNDSAEYGKSFAIEFLRQLHEQQVKKLGGESIRRQGGLLGTISRQRIISQLLSSLTGAGDMRRLLDWAQNSFNLASVSELTTHFIISKIGTVNCPALLDSDNEDKIVPRFLLFNQEYVDVPFELPLKPVAKQCHEEGHFDPRKKTIVIIHGYLAGYTLVDGLANVKNRILDLNRLLVEKATSNLSASSTLNNSYLIVEDLDEKILRQQYNVIIVDLFKAVNPSPRFNYIKAAANAPAVGRLIARFLSSLVSECGAPASSIQLLAHSLGCHVAGFTGKAMVARGQKLGRITHLDPIGLCFGRLFSTPNLRLSPGDAHETRAVHVSLNLFDNPLDGAEANFLVNGGRDQPGCGQSELQNSTTSSVELLVDPKGKFRPCSHLRSLTLFEEDLSSEPDKCQIVGYKCANYNSFLAGKCGRCDATNSQCRLMTQPPLDYKFKPLNLETSFSGVSTFLAKPKSRPTHREDTRYLLNVSLNGYSDFELSARKADFYQTRLHNNTIKRRYIRQTSMDRIIRFAVNPRQFLPHLLNVHSESLNAATHSEMPLGSQPLPEGSSYGSIYYVGTSSVATFCVNYYQVRFLLARKRLDRFLQSNAQELQLTVKTVDSEGRFFRGFSLVESSEKLRRAPLVLEHRNEPVVELTMLLNSTKPEPIRITETIVSYYFHRIVLVDLIEVNFMSNISPQ